MKYLARLFGKRVDIDDFVDGFHAVAYRWRGVLYVWRSVKHEVRYDEAIRKSQYDPKQFRRS